MRLSAYIFFLISIQLTAQVYPGAVGFGSDWNFPTNYEVRIVTSLSGGSGAGSIRNLAEATTTADGVILVFNGLSGTITLDEAINIGLSKKIYIEGATSENGIWLRMKSDVNDQAISSSGTDIDGFILRNMTLALGETTNDPETVPHGGEGDPGSGDSNGNVNGDNMTLLNGSNIMVDRCTLLWSTDESLQIWIDQNITIQNSIIAESLMYASHAYTTDNTEGAYYAPHSMGMLIGSSATNITFYNNLWAHNNQRNPLAGNTGGTQNTEFVNQYIYNWGNLASNFNEDTGIINLNIKNVVYDNGPDSSGSRRPFHINPNIGAGDGDGFSVHVGSLYSDLYGTDWDAIAYTDQTVSIGTRFVNPAPEKVKKSTPHSFPLASETALSRAQIQDMVLENSGTIFNSPTEQRIKNTVINGNGGLIDDPVDVGGYPTIPPGTIIDDSDSDGIPDSEEAEWGDDTFGYLISIGNTNIPLLPGSEAKKKKAANFSSNFN